MRLRPCAPTRRLHTGIAASAGSLPMTSGRDSSTRPTVSCSNPPSPEPALRGLTPHTSSRVLRGQLVRLSNRAGCWHRLPAGSGRPSQEPHPWVSGSQINVTLDNNTATFPLNQILYFNFTHNTKIIAVLTAFGLKQFSGKLDPSSHPGEHNFTVSHLTPFGARLNIEILRTPRSLVAD